MPTALSAFEASRRRADTACPVILVSSLEATTVTSGFGTPFRPITCHGRRTTWEVFDKYFSNTMVHILFTVKHVSVLSVEMYITRIHAYDIPYL